MVDGEVWHEVPVRTAFEDGLGMGRIGSPLAATSIAGVLVLMVVLGVIIPIDEFFNASALLFIGPVVFGLVGVVRDQVSAGRGWRHIVAAITGATLGAVVILGVLVGSSLLLGPIVRATGAGDWIGSLWPDVPAEVWMVALGCVAVAIVLVLFRRLYTGEYAPPSDAELQRRAVIREERAARFAATGREAIPLLSTGTPGFDHDAKR